MKEKIIITGSKGQLGSELAVLSNEYPQMDFFFVDVDELDITDAHATRAYFEEIKPTHCINCAAYTAVDKAEDDKVLCDAINVKGVENLATACKEHGASLFHISTDFVFDGTSSQPIDEAADTNPISYYGISKLNGEAVIIENISRFYIIRTSWLYSSLGNNFVKTMLRLAETKDELGIIFDQIGTPTYARDLAGIILRIITTETQNYGVYHFSNEGVASWYDFTKAIFEYKNIKTRVNPIYTAEYPTPAKRPHYSVMDKHKIKTTFQLEIPHWRESLKKCLELI